MFEFSWAAAGRRGREWNSSVLSVLVGRIHAIKGCAVLRSRWRSTRVDLPKEVVQLQSLGVRS